VSEKNRFAFISFGKNPVFTSLHLRSPVHVVPPLRDTSYAMRRKMQYYIVLHISLSLSLEINHIDSHISKTRSLAPKGVLPAKLEEKAGSSFVL
jgi:hypothetical protein